jgi:hypothetical protein
LIFDLQFSNDEFENRTSKIVWLSSYICSLTI